MPPKRTRRAHTQQSDSEQQTGSNQGAQLDPVLAQSLQTLTQQTDVLAQQQQQMQQQILAQQQQQQHQQPVPPVVTFKSFQAIHPPEFKGSADPIEAKNWLKEMEKAFALVKVPGEKQTEYASYFLKNEANYWWKSVYALEEGGMVTWDRFKELFLEKYFPAYMSDQMELKFF